MTRRTEVNVDHNDPRHANELMSRTADDDDDDDDGDDEYDDEYESDYDSRTVAATWDERLVGSFLTGWPSLAVSLTVLLVAWAIQQHQQQQQHVAVSLSTSQQQHNEDSMSSSGHRVKRRNDDDDKPIPADVAQYSTYESLGAKPESIGPPHIYDIIDADHDDDSTTSPAAETHSLSTRWLLNTTHLEAYRHDGVICFRGLLSDNLLAQLDVEASALLAERAAAAAATPAVHQKKKMPTQFHTVEHSAMFRNIIIDNHKTNNLDGHDDEAASKNNRTITAATTSRDFPALLQAALFSNISQVAAELLGLATTTTTSMRPEGDDDAEESLPQQQPQQQTLRVIRDIFLAKDSEEYTCGWHVDDVRNNG
jgi:hypothetical protein